MLALQKEQKHKQGLLQNLIKIQDDIDLIQYTITSLLDDGIIADNKDMVDEMIQISSSLEKEIGLLETTQMFKQKEDQYDAYVDIQSGSGGTEAQDAGDHRQGTGRVGREARQA